MPSKTLQSDESNNIRIYNKSDVVVIFKTKEKFGGLSNMAAGYPLQINGINIPTSEALYQACRFPHLPSVQREIVGQYSPMIAKKKVQEFKSQTRSDWDDIRFKIMRWCLRVKLAQNYETFGMLLQSTKEAQIVEQSYKDAYWGANPDPINKNHLIGQNVLGRLLMELREHLITDTAKQLKKVPPLKIVDFSLFGNAITTIDGEVSSVKSDYQSSFF